MTSRRISDMRVAYFAKIRRSRSTSLAGLGLGIALSTAVFTMITVFVMNREPIADPEKYVGLYTHDPRTSRFDWFSYSEYAFLREHNTTLQSLTAWSSTLRVIVVLASTLGSLALILAAIGIGVVTGLAGSWALSRAMSQLFERMGGVDPMAFAGSSALLALVAMTASYLPARRATMVDPVFALRRD